MALLFMDGFDHYDDAQIDEKWHITQDTPTITTGRFGNCLSLAAGPAAEQVWWRNPSGAAVWIVGFAVRFSNVTDGTQSTIFLRLRDFNSEQVDVRLPSGNPIMQVTRNGTVLGTSNMTFQNNVWYYVEFKVNVNNSGSWELRINGINVSSGSGDTSNTGNAYAERLVLSGIGQTGSSNITLIDDLYICDGTGSAPTNDFLGDCRVEAIFPNGNGNSSVLVGSDGNSTDNYLLVDETTTVNDADYVQSATVNDKDTYAMTNVTPTLGTVYGVQPTLRAWKNEAGLRSVKSVARLSGTEVDGAAKPLSVTPVYHYDIRETKPGGGAWSISDVNSAEFGVKVA